MNETPRDMRAQPTTVIYHDGCQDGFGAAWAVNKALRGSIKGEDLQFFPGMYQTAPPLALFKGRHIIIVDFSFKRAVMDQIADVADHVTWLDHHKSAIQDMEGWAQERNARRAGTVEGCWTTVQSGAMLAWRWFFPTFPAPQLLRHIEDRDLWQFRLAHTKEICANLFTMSYDFALWDKLMYMSMEEWKEFLREGTAVVRGQKQTLEQMLKACTRELRIGGMVVPAANVPHAYSSDAGHELGKYQPFAASYYDTVDGRNFSLRSDQHGVDVSEIAKTYGGGGHAHAAGFRVSYEKAREFEMDYVMHQPV